MPQPPNSRPNCSPLSAFDCAFPGSVGLFVATDHCASVSAHEGNSRSFGDAHSGENFGVNY
jgi:hypothetical protein